VPLILSGGLTPDNVADAIATVRPFAVDVASGVESSPGRKDPAKLEAFAAAVASRAAPAAPTATPTAPAATPTAPAAAPKAAPAAPPTATPERGS
jgi:phosphoribosylanthranilate isomerase